GTASATVPFIAAAVRSQGLGGAAKVSIVASVFMMAFCVLRLGRHVGTVPHSVLAGFSAGTGAIMIVCQFHVLFCVAAPGAGSALSQWVQVVKMLDDARLAPMIISGIAIIVAAVCTDKFPKMPAPLAGVALSGLVAWAFRFHEPDVGSLSLTLPSFAGFSWSPEDVLAVIPSGLALAFVTSVNLLMTSRVVERFRGGDKPMQRTQTA